MHAGNLGAVVRVAAAAGAAGVIAVGGRDPWEPDAIRGAAGLQYALPVARADRVPATARPIVAVDPQGVPFDAQPPPPGALLVFGTEREGLPAEILSRAHLRTAIPMRPGVSSLNLATAVAVVLYASPRDV
ncbi:MAG TPA: TrmH family RNA methyltransferase [Gemmatimonadota bacterium]|nr:TrmH family RNA methyltransferase [Gemmatimonadota bacterium]